MTSDNACFADLTLFLILAANVSFFYYIDFFQFMLARYVHSKHIIQDRHQESPPINFHVKPNKKNLACNTAKRKKKETRDSKLSILNND